MVFGPNQFVGPMTADIPIPPPRVDSSKGPNRVNRAHWHTKENQQNITILFAFVQPMVNWPEMTPNGARNIFVTNPNLVDMLDRMDLIFERLHLSSFPFFFGTKILARHGTEILGTARIIRARHGNIWHGTDHKGTARKSAASRKGGTGVFLTRHGTSESPESERL